MRKRSLHERLLDAAEHHHGVVGRSHLIDAGFSAAAVDHARRSSRLCPVFRGAYAVGRPPETTNSVWYAATVTGGHGSVLMGQSAAQLWGMLQQRDSLPRLVEVGRPSGLRTRTMRGLCPSLDNTELHLRQRTFRDGEVVTKHGIPVTTPARTQIDLAGTIGPNALSHCFTEACRLHLIVRRDLPILLERSCGLPGAARVRRLAQPWVPELELTRSPLEGRFLIDWVARDRRIPEVNVDLGIWEVDFLWRAEKVVVELDGRAYHDNDIARHRDARKDRWLRSQGYTVLRFGYHDVHEFGETTYAKVRHLLDAA